MNNEFLIENRKLSDLKKISDQITEKYKNNTLDGKKMLTSADEALVYALVRMPATNGAVKSVLYETFKLLDGDFVTAFDAGAGTGAGSLALKDRFANIKITCLEREKEMIIIGKKFLPDEEWINADITNYNIDKSYDIILASYVLNEIKESNLETILKKLYEKTNKVLILIDAGTQKNSKVINTARNLLIGWGGQIVAPCVGHCLCQNPEWCHFYSRIERNKIHRYLKSGETAYEDEKFSYISIAKEKIQPPFYRITRHPVIEKDKVTLELCTSDGIIKKTYKKKDCLYKTVKKLKWGNAFDEYTNLRQE